jgi:type IV pilus assembly protein PilM
MDKSNTYFHKDKPLFGLDVGFSSIKVMQLRQHGKKYQVVGYGVGGFDNSLLKDGEVVGLEKMAEAINELFKNNLIGSINTKRVAVNIPSSRTYTRTMQLPRIADNELREAVLLEAAQYIPLPVDDLYLDYNVIHRDDKNIELLAVAAPRRVVDSYMNLSLLLGLEPVAFDTSIGASGRLFERQAENEEIPAVLIDFGAVSADVTVHDKTSIVTGTVGFGGDTLTDLISKKLGVSKQEGHLIKTKYGVAKSKKQTEILEVVKPEIDQLAKEVKRMIRYYEERSGSTKKIGQVVTMGGGANTPGLSELLTEILRLPVRMCDPWLDLYMHKLQPPSGSEKSMYMTVAGLALIEPKEVFSS